MNKIDDEDESRRIEQNFSSFVLWIKFENV